MNWPMTLVFPFLAFFISMIGTRALIRFLGDYGIFDTPNERSSHVKKTPLGGGLAVVLGVFPIWIAIGHFVGAVNVQIVALSGIGMVLGGVSWVDDVRGLSPAARFGMHVLAVSTGLWLAPFSGLVFGGVFPPMIDIILAGILWVWFINLFNFMDGIDGLSGVEMLALGIGLFVAARKLDFGETQMLLSLTIGAAGLGFLRWNWHPAKIFMGDVGSIPVGFAAGWLLLETASRGAWAVAIILPLYYLADATLTLILRVWRGERFWEPHRLHFYQRAVASGLRHDQVAWIIAIANMFLVMLSIVAMRGLPEAAILGAVGAVAMLLFLLVKGGPTDG